MRRRTRAGGPGEAASASGAAVKVDKTTLKVQGWAYARVIAQGVPRQNEAAKSKYMCPEYAAS